MTWNWVRPLYELRTKLSESFSGEVKVDSATSERSMAQQYASCTCLVCKVKAWGGGAVIIGA